MNLDKVQFVLSLKETFMFNIEVRLNGKKSEIYEFLEGSMTEARRRAEEIAREGFWVEEAEPPFFVPPSRIELVQVFPKK